MASQPWSDERVESMLGVLLRAGVLLAAAVVAAGGAVYLLRHGSEPADYRVFHGEPSSLRSIHGILGGLGSPGGRSIIQFGLLLLIATPIARVVLSALAFALQRDRAYVIITLIVLAILLLSLSGVLSAA